MMMFSPVHLHFVVVMYSLDLVSSFSFFFLMFFFNLFWFFHIICNVALNEPSLVVEEKTKSE